jgi:hypothetical protein
MPQVSGLCSTRLVRLKQRWLLVYGFRSPPLGEHLADRLVVFCAGPDLPAGPGQRRPETERWVLASADMAATGFIGSQCWTFRCRRLGSGLVPDLTGNGRYPLDRRLGGRFGVHIHDTNIFSCVSALFQPSTSDGARRRSAQGAPLAGALATHPCGESRRMALHRSLSRGLAGPLWHGASTGR